MKSCNFSNYSQLWRIIFLARTLPFLKPHLLSWMDESHIYILYYWLLLLLSRFSCIWLCATPQTAAHQAPPSLGFSRQEHWSGLPFPSPTYYWQCPEITYIYIGQIFLCWERWKLGGERDDRGWDGWMASLTQWTWVWVNSGRWCWKGRLARCSPWGHRVRHDWVTEMNWNKTKNNLIYISVWTEDS